MTIGPQHIDYYVCNGCEQLDVRSEQFNSCYTITCKEIGLIVYQTTPSEFITPQNCPYIGEV